MSADTARLVAAIADRYRIERELGAGGMATVYLAQDLKHDRKVAIKVLRPELAAVIGADRFLSEIKTTANLQHPHILPLFDSGVADSFLFYVMPFIEGESLRDRLNREKQLPINDAVRIATEVASALDYAHRHNVIHRDIKPENIMLHDGQALVADFGIALAASKAGGSRMTETGMSLGTPTYMSPEQAMGEREITARSDVYALGAMTYEMLLGEPPFTGPTAQSIVAKVMTEKPASLIARRDKIPPAVEDAVLTALEKLPADRWASAAEFGATLRGEGTREHRTTGVTRASATLPPRPSRLLIGAVAAGLVTALGAGYLLGHSRPVPRPLHASLPPPTGCTFAPVSTSNLVQASPDGSMVAFIAICGDDQALWIRNLVSGAVQGLTGTSDATYPFWAPDSRGLGFFAKNKLKRVDLQSGAVRDLAPVVAGRGGSWSAAGVILYAPDIAGPLYQISAEGGTPEHATVIPQDSAGTIHRLPYFLPDGRTFLFTQGSLSSTEGTVRVSRLGSSENHILLDFPTNVAYAAGRLLFVRDGLLMAQRFDPGNSKLSGGAVSLIPGLETWQFKYLGNFSTAASTDLLVYQPAPVVRARVSWFNPRTGQVSTVFEPGAFGLVRISPKGDQVLIERGDRDGPLMDIWLYQPAGQAWTRITSHPDLYYDFAWSPDGSRIGYGAANDSVPYLITLDRSSTTPLPARGRNSQPMVDWSPDGSFLLGWRQVGSTGFDLIVTPLVGDSAYRVLYSTPGNDVSPRLSPDGKLLAFISDQSGRSEVYLTRMPDAKVHWQVSSNGVEFLGGFRSGLAWGRNGRELYFVGGDGQLMSATITDQAGMRIGRPVAYPAAPRNIISFDTAPDGRLVLVCDEAPGQLPLSLVEHWPAMLEAAK